jgi:glycerophosphoryl diester phosphodiesterase
VWSRRNWNLTHRLQSAGYRVFVYTVNDPVDIRWTLSLGVDGIISDFPERIQSYLKVEKA